ncbi:MAG: diaminopimelate epimerase [Thermogutta sp.]|nr:diaminopimelate epimerase [Thermogutta sp.]
MRFVKMQGAGNDYIYVDCFRETLPQPAAELAPRIADRHFGVGGDGLILITPSEVADARMRMFNADGSEAEMCGNGVRCVAKYVYESGISRNNPLRIETGRGVLALDLTLDKDRVQKVRVNMGEPILNPRDIPTTLGEGLDRVTEYPLEVEGFTLPVTCVSMGNPHCVVFTEELTDSLVHGLGCKIERHPAFPRRVNVEFVRVESSDAVQARVWERGSGETLACGTGACAACVAGVLTGRTDRRIAVRLPGGILEIEWSEDGMVFLAGPAVEVFRGVWPE